MKNGCSECEKLPDDKMCNACELEMAKSDADSAVKEYQRLLIKKRLAAENGKATNA